MFARTLSNQCLISLERDCQNENKTTLSLFTFFISHTSDGGSVFVQCSAHAIDNGSGRTKAREEARREEREETVSAQSKEAREGDLQTRNGPIKS